MLVSDIDPSETLQESNHPKHNVFLQHDGISQDL